MLSAMAFDAARLRRRSQTDRREPILRTLKPKCHGYLVAFPSGGLVAPLQYCIHQRQGKIVGSCPLGHANPVLNEYLANFGKLESVK